MHSQGRAKGLHTLLVPNQKLCFADGHRDGSHSDKTYGKYVQKGGESRQGAGSV